jgi:Flp pilus assembly protein TadG
VLLSRVSIVSMQAINQFARDRRGSVLFLFAFAFMALGLSVGIAIDSARIYSVDKRVQMALDAAALSGAKLLGENPDATDFLQQIAYSSFQANVKGISAGEASLSGFVASPNTSTSMVTATVNATVPTTLGRLAGLGQVSAGKSASASYKQVRLEVVLALDVTGSMLDTPPGDTQSKLAAMKAAANQLVNGLYDSASADSSVRIGLVPWSSGVNVGSYLATATGSNSGSACIVERSGSGATTDSLPSASTYAQPMASAHLDMGYLCPSQSVQPLRDRQSRTAVTGMISGLNAVGGTAGHIGTAWGWYMLSHNWASAHPPGSKPEATSPNVIKSIIIMTDGVFNTSFVGGVLNSGSGGYNADSYDMFQTLCSGMRAQGIRVYTVAFDVTDATALANMQSCADAGNALSASNASQLMGAFNTIVSELKSIKLAN